MKNKTIIWLAALLSLSGAGFSQTLPELPSIWPEVMVARCHGPSNLNASHQTQNWGIADTPLQPGHTRPHIPAFRTTADGRIGMKTLGVIGFSILKSEKVSTYRVTLVKPKKIILGSTISKDKTPFSPPPVRPPSISTASTPKANS
jgi:hypothetical protein